MLVQKSIEIVFQIALDMSFQKENFQMIPRMAEI